jgi:hypothetical protein
VARSNPTPPASCVLLPGVDRKQLAEKSQNLEAAAAAAHKAAQELNKQGRYEVCMTGIQVLYRLVAVVAVCVSILTSPETCMRRAWWW